MTFWCVEERRFLCRKDTLEVEGVDGFADGSVFEQVQVVEKLPGAHRRVLQSPSAAESPKQDCGGRRSASTLMLQLLGQRWLSQRLEGRRDAGGLAGEASKEGLVSGSSGGF
jgi:hypothetical protein